MLLAIARHMLETDRCVNREFLERADELGRDARSTSKPEARPRTSTTFSWVRLTKHLDAEFTFERAAEESGVPIEKLKTARGDRTRSRTPGASWHRTSGAGPATGNLGGWQIARATGVRLRAVRLASATRGARIAEQRGTSSCPKAFDEAAEPQTIWNELLYPKEYPLAFHELSPILPYLVDGREPDRHVLHARVQPGLDLSRTARRGSRLLARREAPWAATPR